MSRKYTLLLVVLVSCAALASLGFFLNSHDIPVLQSAGPIGHKERNLILLAIGLSAIVVIPVYAMLIGFALRYREGNKKARYQPDFDHNRIIESIWWGIPLLIISILAVVTWNSSKELDPFRPLNSSARPMTIQVVALQWKWLFIYPEQGVASVNFVELPVNRPVDFQITADAPMNSFWIPSLGGQIYAMSGMSTHLHLMADRSGDYKGSSANISGDGFASMHFIARAATGAEFNQWIGTVKSSGGNLNPGSYNKLSQPGTLKQPIFYSSADSELYNGVVSKFEGPFHSIPVHEEGAS